jgi:radical SAM superfamily enzyme YgiQ (UPF0313 family)
MRIAMIAMSGVRAHNPELTKLGLTLPGFVERNRTIASLPSLGLLTLAGLTPPRHTVRYYEVADLRDSGGLPEETDLVALSTFTAQVKEAWTIADTYRARGIPVVMGGITAGALVDECLQHCTSVVSGEGELLWPQVLSDAERGALKPRYQPGVPSAFDLREAPMPRFELLDPGRYNRLTVQTSRGCPHRCSFCASSILLTPRYSVKPVHKVLAEIRQIKRFWPRPFIEFADDNSFRDRRHARDLLRALVGERIRWFTETDISIAQDPELLGLLRDSGCQQVLIGLESPRQASLYGLEERADWKARQRDAYAAGIARIQSYGVTVNGCFILGLDGDTPEIFPEVLKFVRESGLYEVQVTFLTPFPGTPLYRQLETEGRLSCPGAWERCTLFDINFHPRGMTADQLQSGFLDLVRQLYSTEETASRRRRFRLMTRQSPQARRAGRRQSEPRLAA